jgi:regulator of sirC expression with transglutaminase-like and TPR domain
MSTVDASSQRFEALSSLPDCETDLAELALLVATERYPELRSADYLDELDRLADRFRERVDAAGEGLPRLEALCRCYREAGFRANTDDYYDPRNSYLNDVLERRTGIPITLSVVLMELGHRLGVMLRGVCFPGHFLLRYDDQGLEPTFVDAFHSAVILDESDCKRLLKRVTRGKVEFQKQLLDPVPKRRILMRMLRNLKGIHVRRGDTDAALFTVDRLLTLGPRDHRERRDRGMLRYEVGDYQGAIDDLALYLTHVGVGPDALVVRARLMMATERLAARE